MFILAFGSCNQAAVGRHHSLFVTETGKVLSCGKNDTGQLGRSGKGNKPQAVPGLDSVVVVQASCGGTLR